MQRYAIMFRIKPGSEEKVKTLLSGYAPPEWVTPDGTRLLSTSVFLKDGLLVRLIEIDGNLPSLMAHLATQPSVQQLERELDEHIVEEDRRDTGTPDGARAFFRRAMMEHVTTRVATS
ncbi:SchA/CurD-like domain-containing protein [Planomonospora venezuelensis]|uniref:SchA/CurD-like domain-containing protein n=1 Tax=Planomonospora venezuelensis TaxID=1999 RepID=A0A841CYB4_PLAVE|nr:SchA/CurD-like domain-containing protein [Planomonospora venezuelensis]MBB5962420.1 hypothetical protein [Planomonospora venezuelensis]GIN00802.1 hypothetical protein Pve01_24600 [Planomonospora venezuelensis]